MYWAVAAFAVPLVLAVPIGGASALLVGLFVVCFVAGSLCNAWLLARSPRRDVTPLVLRGVSEPKAIEGAAPEESVHTGQPVEPVRQQPVRRTVSLSASDRPAFASGDSEGYLEVAVLVSANRPPMDPAEGTPTVTAPVVYDDGARTPQEIPAQPEPEEDVSQFGTPGPYPGSVLPKANGRAPHSSYRVKGNTRSMRYHTMQSPYYERTKAGVWFRSTADAERAGFEPWNKHLQASR